MKILFCDEKIVRVYLQRFKYDYPDADFFFDYFDDIVFYTTDEYKIILETENRMISIGINGVFNIKKEEFVLEYKYSEFLESDSYELPGDDECYVGFQTELFVGERLINVEKSSDIFFLTFDDFTMSVMPFNYKKSKSECRDLLEFARIAGCDRYIKRKCDCGGDAEILFRSLPGYVVRCKKCYKSTDGFDCISEAAEKWNLGKTPGKIN